LKKGNGLAVKLDDLPEFITSQDLVDLGLYPSRDAVYLARARGHSPDFIKINRKVLYSKNAVKRFIQSRMQIGSNLEI
jgi:hypothetical protein